jgi:hypothetical protein
VGSVSVDDDVGGGAVLVIGGGGDFGAVRAFVMVLVVAFCKTSFPCLLVFWLASKDARLQKGKGTLHLLSSNKARTRAHMQTGRRTRMQTASSAHPAPTHRSLPLYLCLQEREAGGLFRDTSLSLFVCHQHTAVPLLWKLCIGDPDGCYLVLACFRAF